MKKPLTVVPPPLPPANVPAVGAIVLVPTPAGPRLYRVFRAHRDRVALVPCTPQEIAEQAEAYRAAQAARPWWQRARAWRPWRVT